MRSVDLSTAAGSAPPAERAEIARKMRHLRNRMEEFLPDGLQVRSGILPEGWGFVDIRLPRLESRTAAAYLHAQFGIASAPPDEGGMLRFLVTNRVRFEDMDYVQGAVTELFSLPAGGQNAPGS